MKPILKTNDDFIRSIGDASWESMPTSLERRLVETPAKVVQHETQLFERAPLILNIIISLWVLTSILIFREYWLPIVLRLTENLSIHIIPPYQWISHPIAILVLLGVCWFSILFSDMENRRT